MAFQNLLAVRQFTKTNHTDTYDFISPSKADLSGRSVFITGASKGIGRATALSFAAAGCSKIAVGARSDLSGLVQEIKDATSKSEHPPLVIAVKLDVASEDSVKAAVETVGREFGGKLDVLINNAGYLETWKPIGDSDPVDWWASWEVNLRGTYLVTKYSLPLLLAGQLKTNVLTSSYGAISVRAGASAYQSSKFATVRLAEYLDAEYSQQGLVTLAIHPGGIKTELAEGMPKEMHSNLTDELPLPADTLVWLAKENRPWLGGRFLSVAWDMQELEARKDEIVQRDLLRFRLTV